MRILNFRFTSVLLGLGIVISMSCGDGRLSPQGGTITSVQSTSGGGLTGGGTGGAVSLGLKTICTSTQVLAWDGDSWECAYEGTLGLTTYTVETPSSFSTQQDNFALGGNTGILRLNCTNGSGCDFTGLQGGLNGRHVDVCNVGANTIRFYEENGNSTAANRFAGTTNTWPLLPGYCTGNDYDGTTQRWRQASWSGNAWPGGQFTGEVTVRGTGGASTLTPTAGTLLTLDNTASDIYMSMLVGSANSVGIYFGNTTSTTDGGVLYNNSVRTLFLRAGTTAPTSLNSSGVLTHTGNFTAGDATTDSHSFTGATSMTDDGVTLGVTGTGNGAFMTVAAGGSTRTASNVGAAFSNAIGFDTTSGILTNSLVTISVSSSRSAGSNSLSNRALTLDALNGQENLALLTERGDLRLNNTSGSARFYGQMFAGDTASSNIPTDLDVFTLGQTGTGLANNIEVVNIADSGTYLGLTTGQIDSYGIKINRSGSCSDCTVANTKKHNYSSIYIDTHGDDVGDNAVINWSLVTDRGSNFFNEDPNYDSLFGGNISMNPGKTLFVETISPFPTGGGFATGGGVANPGGNSYSYGSGTGNLTIITATAGSLNLNPGGSGFINIGNSTGDLATFSNGPRGVNLYGGTHFEFVDEFMARLSAPLNGSSATDQYIFQFDQSGAGALDAAGSPLGDTTAVSGRLGVWALDTGLTASGSSRLAGNTDSVDFADGSFTFEGTFYVLALSTAVQEYTFVAGFNDVFAAVDQVDGCYFMYDRGDLAANPNTGDTGGISGDNWSIWCASNSTRTGYKLDGTASEDSFTTVSSAVAATTWYRFKIVMEGTTKARFFINGTEVGRITTNIPSGNTRATQTAFQVKKHVGTANSYIYVDQTVLDVTLNSVRSP